MKSRDFRKLNESIDFSVTKSYEDEQGRTVHDMSHFGKRQPVECWVCDGTGKDKFYDEAKCDYCEGKGKRDEFVSDAPEMNVSNSNAFKIIDMLGLEQDYAGSIENKDLPALMRKLIQLKNSDRSQYAEPGSQSGGKIGTYKDQAGMDTIGRKGPMLYNMGTTDDQVTAYVDQLIKIIKFAQDNDADFGWG
jgi:hypothetical protein|tara:strand:- start:2203 stop:2775 length:573 start_codon:yes stop_codon:yes gene_type:complete